MGNKLLEMFGVSLTVTIAVELIVVLVCAQFRKKCCEKNALCSLLHDERTPDPEESHRGFSKKCQRNFLGGVSEGKAKRTRSIRLLPAIHGRNGILLVILVNVLTNPAAVLLCLLGRRYMPGVAQMPVQLFVEAVVVTAEAWIYVIFSKDERWKIVHPVMLSVLANLCSWLTGVILMAVRR